MISSVYAVDAREQLLAKAAGPKESISARISADITAEIQAIVDVSGQNKTEVIEDLIRLGLAAKRGKPEPGQEAERLLGRVLSELAEVKARLSERPKPEPVDGNKPVLNAIEEFGDGLAKEMASERRKLVDDLAEKTREHVVTLRQSLGVVWLDVLRRMFPKADAEELRKLIKQAFES